MANVETWIVIYNIRQDKISRFSFPLHFICNCESVWHNHIQFHAHKTCWVSITQRHANDSGAIVVYGAKLPKAKVHNYSIGCQNFECGPEWRIVSQLRSADIDSNYMSENRSVSPILLLLALEALFVWLNWQWGESEIKDSQFSSEKKVNIKSTQFSKIESKQMPLLILLLCIHWMDHTIETLLLHMPRLITISLEHL